jgi:hypothetical protein
MSAEGFFFSFWWLIFPVGGMLMGLFAMIGHYSHRKETLRILKSYADQGKDPPAALLDALKSDEDRAMDYAYYGRRRWRRYRGYGWGGFGAFVPFAAMAAGFGWFGYYGGGPSVFMALAVAFGIAAAFMFVGGIVGMITRPKLPPHDKDAL